MNINLIYEVNNREFDNCVLIQRELMRRGHRVNIYNKTEDLVLSNTNVTTVIPNSYRTEDLMYYQYVFNTRNNPLIVFPCEQITNHELPLFFDYSSNNKVKRLPHLCWGDDYYEFITSLGFDNKYNKIVGAPQLDFCRKQFKSFFSSKEQLAQEFKLPKEKKWILFISDFVFTSELMVEQIKESGDSDEFTLRELYKLENKTQDKLIEWFEQFLKKNTDFIIIYRKHPLELLSSKIEKLRAEMENCFFTISELNIKEWISNCDRLACWYSTSVIECMFAEKKIALLRPYEFTEGSKLSDYEFLKDFVKISSYDQFEDSMKYGEPKFPEKSKKIIAKLYSFDKIPSYIKIADAIEEISVNWEYTELEKKYKIKRLLYLLKKCVPIKVIVKKIYQFMYLKFNFNLAKQGDMHYAILEWNNSALNKTRYLKISKKIDKIISNEGNKYV